MFTHDSFAEADLRNLLERTLFTAQERGLVSQTQQGFQHQDGPLVLSYDPHWDELSLVDQSTQQVFRWQGEQVIQSGSLSAQQLAEFSELSDDLDHLGVPATVDLSRTEPPDLPNSDGIAALAQTAQQLFEHYAQAGEPAFKLSAEAQVHYYSIELNGLNYFLSRDDASGSYNLQREDTGLGLTPPQGISQVDLQAWAGVADWLVQQTGWAEAEAEHDADGSTYWELHEQQLNQILPTAQQFLSFQESVGESWFAPGERYTTAVGPYQIGYDPNENRYFVQRGEIDLAQVGCITAQDLNYFAQLQSWLDNPQSATRNAQRDATLPYPQPDPESFDSPADRADYGHDL